MWRRWGELLARGTWQSNPVRILVEIILVGLVVKYGFSRRKKGVKEIALSKEVIDQLIEEWEPDELEEAENEEEDVLQAMIGKEAPHVVQSPDCVVLSSYDIFLFNKAPAQDLGPESEEAGTSTAPTKTPPACSEESRKKKVGGLKRVIEEYGVGTCGPPGFYGTLDLHLEIEEALAKMLEVEGVVLYAHALVAVSSVIKCFCKNGDVVFYDHRSSISILKGIHASRAKAVPYTSMEDLRNKISVLTKDSTKKFIITEGLFEETGEVAELNEVIRIKRKNNAFLILDESFSIPTLGSRGCVGFFGLSAREVDLWIGSLSNGFGSAGGFCGGTKHAAEQQRLSSLGYCFSASMPGYMTKYALMNIEEVKCWEEALERTHSQSQEQSSISTDDEDTPSDKSSYPDACDFRYAPDLEFPLRVDPQSPRFSRNKASTDVNAMINNKAIRAFMHGFISEKRKLMEGSRARGLIVANDMYSPVVRMAVTEMKYKHAWVVLRCAERQLISEHKIFPRLTERPGPAMQVIISNDISGGRGLALGRTFARAISDALDKLREAIGEDKMYDEVSTNEAA